MPTSSLEHVHAPHLIARAQQNVATRGSADILEALMEALTSGERYRLIERDGEFHLIAQS
jgi:hypothetical protein